MWRNLLRIPIQWSTRSLWSWSDSHTNPLKITKNEISRNQKSPQIERYFLRPWLWIRRDFSKIPIQRPTLSVSREGGSNPIHQKMLKRCFFLPKNSKKHASFTKKGERNAPFAKKKSIKRRSFIQKKERTMFLLTKKCKKGCFFDQKNAKKMFLCTK